MAYCNDCRKTFKTEQALRQHNEDSPAHRPVRCEPCNRRFPHAEALAQHTRSSPAHKDNPTCQPCQRPFPSSEALAQHVKDSPGHAASPRPLKSTATAATSTAAQRPPQPPPSAAAPVPKANQTHPCETCTRTFTTASALSQHTRDSHASLTHPCPFCPHPRSFSSASALAQHIRDAPSHNSKNHNNNNHTSNNHHAPPTPPPSYHQHHTPTTPLDAFFHGYGPTFRYDRALPASTSWRDLCAHNGWRRRYCGDTGRHEWNDPAARDARELYVSALRRELEVWFGGEDDLANWHALCRAVGAVPPPATGKGCERALRGRHVNLVDLVGWARREGEGEGEGGGMTMMGDGDTSTTVEVFGSVRALAEYCEETGKWFPLNEVAEAGEQGDGNVVIRHLLRKLRVRL